MTSLNERPGTPPQPPASTDPIDTLGSPASAPAAPAGAELRTALEDGARAFDQRAQALGREAEAAARRWSEDPAVRETADLAGRLWGLVLLAVGVWFFAGVTLRLDVPAVAWRDVWPIVLILVGARIVIRGLARRA